MTEFFGNVNKVVRATLYDKITQFCGKLRKVVGNSLPPRTYFAFCPELKLHVKGTLSIVTK